MLRISVPITFGILALLVGGCKKAAPPEEPEAEPTKLDKKSAPEKVEKAEPSPAKVGHVSDALKARPLVTRPDARPAVPARPTAAQAAHPGTPVPAVRPTDPPTRPAVAAPLAQPRPDAARAFAPPRPGEPAAGLRAPAGAPPTDEPLAEGEPPAAEPRPTPHIRGPRPPGAPEPSDPSAEPSAAPEDRVPPPLRGPHPPGDPRRHAGGERPEDSPLADRLPVLPPQRVRPNAELLIRKEDLSEVLLLNGNVDVHSLPGIEPDDSYDGIYWGSIDGSQLMVGLQVWHPRSPIEAQRRYTQMVRSYPNAEETTIAGISKTFLAFWNDYLYLAFFDQTGASGPVVVNLTCSRKVCDTPQKLVELATRVFGRLKPSAVKETAPTPPVMP